MQKLADTGFMAEKSQHTLKCCDYELHDELGFCIIVSLFLNLKNSLGVLNLSIYML